MRKIIGIIAATLAAVALAAPAQAVVPAQYDIDEVIFIVDIQNHAKIIGYAPEKDILSLGRTVCKVMRKGVSIGKMMRSMVKRSGAPAYDIGLVVGSAARNLCTDQVPRVERYIANHS